MVALSATFHGQTISLRNVPRLLYDLPYLQKKNMIKVDPASHQLFQYAHWIFKRQDVAYVVKIKTEPTY
jgi:hypothetical protein